MKFINKLSSLQVIELIKEFKITKNEDETKTLFSFYDDALHIIHTKTSDGRKIESIFKDFYIEQIYNVKPSLYDNRRFQNFMIDKLEKFDYRRILIEYLEQFE